MTECVVFGHLVGSTIDFAARDVQTKETKKSDTENPENRVISKSELEKHNTPEDCWIAIDGKVYDLTDFAEEHPAGPESIVRLAGKEGTKEFKQVHTLNMLEVFTPVGLYDPDQ